VNGLKYKVMWHLGIPSGLLIALGIIALLRNLRYLPCIWSIFWPVALMIIGACSIPKTLKYGKFRIHSIIGEVLLIALGAVALLHNLGYVKRIWGIFWPIALIIIGVSLLFKF